VFTYWMQSPWFLNEDPSARFTPCQPPPLQSLALAGRRNGSKSYVTELPP